MCLEHEVMKPDKSFLSTKNKLNFQIKTILGHIKYKLLPEYSEKSKLTDLFIKITFVVG